MKKKKLLTIIILGSIILIFLGWSIFFNNPKPGRTEKQTKFIEDDLRPSCSENGGYLRSVLGQHSRFDYVTCVSRINTHPFCINATIGGVPVIGFTQTADIFAGKCIERGMIAVCSRDDIQDKIKCSKSWNSTDALCKQERCYIRR